MLTQKIVGLILGVIVTLSLAACGEGVAESAEAAKLSSPPAQSGSTFLAEAAKPYRGVVIRGISEHTPASTYVRDVLAPAFEQETGIKVDLEVTSYDRMVSLPIKDMEAGTGIYDFIYVEQDFIFSYLERGFLVNLTQALQQQPTLALPDFNPVDFSSFIEAFKDPHNGDLYGVPMEAFLKTYLYRTDLFEDPALQAAFAARYNYPLAPAITIDQYRDNAAFFTEYGREHGLELWGTTVQAALGHPASTYEFLETIAPAFGVYNWGINLDKYKASVADGGQLNSRQAKIALTFWIDMLKYAPPEATHSTWDEVAASFAAGRVAQGWVYGENTAWIATDSTRSQVVGKVGVALPPTAPGVIEDALVGKGYLGYYDGAAFSIPTSSRNQAAALLWLQYLGRPVVQPEWATTSSRVVHLSTFDDPLVRAQDKRLNGYYTLMKKEGHLFAGAPPFPFHVAVRDVISIYIHQAITGELTPGEALDQAATAVDKELIRLGYSR
ncbi:MAG: ABC transporter substrate-binding protein [Anaerolineae bacterium]|nr:extracellular solute-binding protein [Anaerolineales bacterium]